MKVRGTVKKSCTSSIQERVWYSENIRYQARGPFFINKYLNHNTFEVKPHNWTNGATRKFKATEPYLPSPLLLTSETLENIYQWYLNYEHTPILRPLKKSMQIELHNDTYFHTKHSTTQAKPPNKPSMHINGITFQPHKTTLPTFNEIQNHTDIAPYNIETTTIINIPSNPNLPTLYQRISNSTGKLFFIL